MKNLVRSRIFRYGVAYAGMFFISFLVVLAVLYSLAFRMADNLIEDRLALEAVWLEELLHDGTEFEMVSRLNYHIADHPGSLGIYLLLDAEGKRLAGNLDFTPEVTLTEGEFLSFDHQDDREQTDPPLRILATEVNLPHGCRLLVGQSTEALEQIKAGIFPAAALALALSLVLGVLVAYFLARRLARRLEKINRTSLAILHGDLDTRMECTGSNDEFDHLSSNLNHMLDRIFHLMESVRGVTDNIAHDLRSPLSRMRSRMEVALLSDRQATEYKEVLADTVEDTDRLLSTFNSLLTLARVESGTSGEGFAPLDLARVVDETVEFYVPLAEEKGQSLNSESAGPLPIEGNADLLAQAVANLLDNAIKYAPSGAKIMVRANKNAEGIRLEVEDNGPGIPAHFRQKARERFTRLDASRNLPGQGLGLSLVEVVTERHGGRLLLEDARPGLLVIMELPAP